MFYFLCHNAELEFKLKRETLFTQQSRKKKWTVLLLFFSLGRPIFNSVAYVLDKEMQPVPLDTIGQLYISSANLCDGYVGTKHKNFMPNKVCTLGFLI